MYRCIGVGMAQKATEVESSPDLQIFRIEVDATCAEEGCTSEATHRTDVELDLFDESLTPTIQPPMCIVHAKHYARMFDNYE